MYRRNISDEELEYLKQQTWLGDSDALDELILVAAQQGYCSDCLKDYIPGQRTEPILKKAIKVCEFCHQPFCFRHEYYHYPKGYPTVQGTKFCVSCGEEKKVCCNESTLCMGRHVDPICVDCCINHRDQIYPAGDPFSPIGPLF
jgi:hypothetical protein